MGQDEVEGLAGWCFPNSRVYTYGVDGLEWEAWVPKSRHISPSPGPEVSRVHGIRELLPAHILQG